MQGGYYPAGGLLFFLIMLRARCLDVRVTVSHTVRGLTMALRVVAENAAIADKFLVGQDVVQ